MADMKLTFCYVLITQDGGGDHYYHHHHPHLFISFAQKLPQLFRTSLLDLNSSLDPPPKFLFQILPKFPIMIGITVTSMCYKLFQLFDKVQVFILLNKSWRQHPTKHQLYGHLPPITKTIQVRRNRHAGHCWRSRDELISDVLLWTPHMAEQKQDNQLEHTYSSYVRIWDVALKTCQRRWTIGKNSKRGSEISVLAARHDDDDCCRHSTILTNSWLYDNYHFQGKKAWQSTKYKPHMKWIMCVCVCVCVYLILQNPTSEPHHGCLVVTVDRRMPWNIQPSYKGTERPTIWKDWFANTWT